MEGYNVELVGVYERRGRRQTTARAICAAKHVTSQRSAKNVRRIICRRDRFNAGRSRVVTDNPSSAEAIKASHENLRLIARKAQRTFGTGFLNAGYIAACLRDNYPYERRQFYLTKPKWEPVFEPDAAALSSYGDGAIKINQAIPGYITQDKMRDFTGI